MCSELLSRGLQVPDVSGPSGAKPGEPELKLPSDADVDKVISFLEKVWSFDRDGNDGAERSQI
jgi:hypothetical protein